MRWEHWLFTVPLRLRSIFQRSRVEHELEEEFEFHIEQKVRQEISAGRTPEEARLWAVRTEP